MFSNQFGGTMPALPKIPPHDLADTFAVTPDVYAIGVRERGVTLYNQQVRAHNLVWALCELDKANIRKLGRIAVIGAGAAGLTTAAAFLSRVGEKSSITLFEKEWDLCPVQQGCDGRWLHPSLYDWPTWGSRAPSASLPVLNWSEGRASDVARTLLNGFDAYLQRFDKKQEFSAFIGVHHLQVRIKDKSISWIGTRAILNGPYVSRGRSEGDTRAFDTIIFAAGFGWERANRYKTPSYWRNEQLAQPSLAVDRVRYLVSGYGDGALIDVCRLTIERFRQDTIIYELFGSDLDATEEALRRDLDPLGLDANLFDYFRQIEGTLLEGAKVSLMDRVRKDTSVTLHIAGTDKNAPMSFADIFGRTSSRINRLLTYLLYRCGAISIDRRPLATAVAATGIKAEHVLCRHGCDTDGHLKLIIDDYNDVQSVFDKMKMMQAQKPERFWELGYFPVCQRS
jgi:hypothetical protein